MCSILTATAVVLVVLASHGSAAADRSFLELFGGRATPVADEQYRRRFDESLKLGGRVGIGTGSAVIEANLDVSPMDMKTRGPLAPPLRSMDLTRVRILVGARLTTTIGSSLDVFGRVGSVRVFGRVAGGIDVMRVKVVLDLFDRYVEESESDLGFALELGGGLMFDVGRLSLGGQIALPMTIPFDEDDDPDDPYPFNNDYSGIDLDVMFAAAVLF